MKHAGIRWMMAVGFIAVGVMPAAVAAEEAPKALPTLLIKGEIVSVDTNDPAESLLKVKDRYGFETPIYLGTDTKIAQGDQAITSGQLNAGAAVEVEYNFDINTAKRHAVRVALNQPAAAQASATPAAVAPVVPVDVAAPESAASVTPATPEAAPAASEPAVTPDAPSEPTTPEESTGNVQ